MFYRDLEEELKTSAKAYPVITLIGPRQAGKTTVVKKVFANKPYVNLEAPDTRERVLADPRRFLEKYPTGAILDEVQRTPELLSYLQIVVDENPVKGQFILTGSHQLELHQAISQSLAGRTALLNLLPMSLKELMNAGFKLTIDDYVLMGGYPRIFQDHLEPTKAYRNYFQTYVERDLRQLIHVKDLMQFQKFVKLCAGRIGQLLNLEGLATEVGVSAHTIKEWVSILEASFIIFRLQPYYENFGKRVVKSAKLFFVDVGLATYLLGISNTDQLERDPLRGHLIENLILLELIKARYNRGLDAQLYYFRDLHGHEVDAVFQNGRDLIPIEIKSGQTFRSDFLKNLFYFQKIVQDRCPTGYVIYAGKDEQPLGHFHLMTYPNTYQIVT